jgi:hypothetical protein
MNKSFAQFAIGAALALSGAGIATQAHADGFCCLGESCGNDGNGGGFRTQSWGTELTMGSQGKSFVIGSGSTLAVNLDPSDSRDSCAQGFGYNSSGILICDACDNTSDGTSNTTDFGNCSGATTEGGEVCFGCLH